MVGEAVSFFFFFFSLKKSIIEKISAIRLGGLFGQGIKWDAPLGLDFGLRLWRLHTLAVQVERRRASSWP